MEDNFVKCRDGKDREIFPALIGDRKAIQHFSMKFRSDLIIMNLMSPDVEKIKRANKNNEELQDVDMFTDEPFNAMMEILYMAFGKKYPKEEIESFIDVSMIPKILDIFYGISGYKKKANQVLGQELAGKNLSQAL